MFANTETFVLAFYGSTITLVLGLLTFFANSIKKKNTSEHNSTVTKIDSYAEAMQELKRSFDGFLVKDEEDKRNISSNLQTLHGAVHEITTFLLKGKHEN